MRVALSATAGILSALALLLIKESAFLLSEYRQASERHELADKSTGPLGFGREPVVAVPYFEVRLSVASVQECLLRLHWR